MKRILTTDYKDVLDFLIEEFGCAQQTTSYIFAAIYPVRIVYLKIQEIAKKYLNGWINTTLKTT